MSISKIRSALYKSAGILGDVQAITSGRPKKILARLHNKFVGKHVSAKFNKKGRK